MTGLEELSALVDNFAVQTVEISRDKDGKTCKVTIVAGEERAVGRGESSEYAAQEALNSWRRGHVNRGIWAKEKE